MITGIMQRSYLFVLLTLMASLIADFAIAQTTSPPRMERGGVENRFRIDESTPIFDKMTGKRVSFGEYQRLLKDAPNSVSLMPIWDEYGQASSYTLRPTTAEERETRQFSTMDPTQRPKVGEPMPLFIMKGIDDKVYRSTDLKGHVVILSFWISVRKPFWGTRQAQEYADAIRPFRSETDPISLGILQSGKDEIVKVMSEETLPFIAIPNSYGFHRKFHVTTGPSFLIIDRNGMVADFIEAYDYERLKQVLTKVSR